MAVYELVEIEKSGAMTEADSARIGNRFIPTVISEGIRAVLVHAEDYDKAMITSRVASIADGSLHEQTEIIKFVTQNTTYTLRKVTEVSAHST